MEFTALCLQSREKELRPKEVRKQVQWRKSRGRNLASEPQMKLFRAHTSLEPDVSAVKRLLFAFWWKVLTKLSILGQMVSHPYVI